MSKLRAVLMMADVTASRCVQPLIDILKTNPPMTEPLRDFLIELLERTGKFKLKFVAPRGRKTSTADSERRLAVSYRFEELAGAKIQSIFCDEIAKSLGCKKIIDRKPATPKTFNLDSAKDHVAKLDRELSRLGSASDPEAAIDHGTNAAMTGWHLSDWVRVEISRSPEAKAAASKILGIENLAKAKFQEAIRSKCVAIQYWEGVAVSTKTFQI